MALVLAAQRPGSDPDYPLGKIGLPPVTEAGSPVRVVDLEGRLDDQQTTTAAGRVRMKLGSRVFAGGELRGDRIGAFVDTQRFEFGVTEEEGAYDVEGAIRAPWFLLRLDASRRDDFWAYLADGAIRIGNDWEVLLSYRHDENDEGGGAPSLEAFIETGRLPVPDPPTRPLRSGSLGFLYQHANDLELRAAVEASRVRTEGGFELDERGVESAVVWNRLPFEIDGRFGLERTGRARRTEAFAELGVAVRMGDHFLGTLRTVQEWQPDVERSVRGYRGGVTFFGRRHRFARANPASDTMLALARRANALGYNERRVYDVDSLRAFRERLSISPAQRELAEAVNTLYRQQVSARNVPQLGVELLHEAREVEGSTTRGYRAFIGIPWGPGWPFARDDAFVEFFRFEILFERDDFRSVGRVREVLTLSVDVELDRQHLVRFRWHDPGQTPEELSLRRRPERRLTVEYIYALGR